LGLSGRGVGPPGVLPRKGGWGVQGDARLATSPLRGGAAAPAASVGPPPRGGVGSRRPPVARRARGASPSGPCCRRASAFRGRSSALRRGVISTRRGRTSWLLRRGGAVRFRVGAGGAEAPSLPRRVRVGLAGAEAPVGRLRGPLRGLSAPPKGVGGPVRRVPLFRRARGLFGVSALPRRSRADTVCRFSRWPEGWWESLLCRSAAGPTRPGPPRWAGSGSAEAVPGGASLVARGRGAAEGVAPKRAAFGLPSWAEARSGSSLLRAEARGREGGESSRLRCGKPRGG
jgi:hypothetical protein